MDKYRLVKAISKKFSSTIAFGGSFSLYLYGIFERPIGDIDIVVRSKDVNKINKWFKRHAWESCDAGSLGVTKQDKDFIHAMFKKQGIHVCIFGNNVIFENNPNILGLTFENTIIYLLPPEVIFKYKQEYVRNWKDKHPESSVLPDNIKKHQKDIGDYKIWKKNGNI